MAQLKDSVVSGNLRVTDTTFTDTLQVTTIKAPTTAGGTTYGPGSNGQVLKSNGTTTYWGADNNSSTVLQSATTTSNFRPLVFGTKDTTTISSLADTVTGQLYTSTRLFFQPSSGNLYMYSPSGDSPALIFQRGTFIDSVLDWKMYDTGGALRFAQAGRNTSTETWNTVIEYKTATNTASTPAIRNMLGVYGTTYGNTAANMLSGTAGLFQYGDGGPQIDFSTAPGGTQSGALIFTDNDTAAVGASWHFVSTEADWNVTSKRFHAKTGISIGTNLPNTSYNLYVNGTTNITGATTIGGLLTTQANQYGDDYNSGAINMQNSNLCGVNAIYTGDTSDNAAEGIHFYRDSTHVDTLWMNGGVLLFVPNRELGSNTSAANSQKVARFTVNPTGGQVVITDSTSGGVKSSGYTIATSVPSGAVFTDTKVTSSANHYTPATASGSDKTASASGATAAWSIDVVKGITINTDGKGHITGLSVTSGKIPANPNTTYTLGTSGDNVTLTPSSGSVQSITVPYATKANLLKYTHTNEINISGGKQSTCYFNYRDADTDEQDAGETPISINYKFCNYRNSTADTTITAANFAGNASTATKWKTARTITIGSTGKSVDGSQNVSWSLAEIGALSSSTKYALSTSVGGNAILADGLATKTLTAETIDTTTGSFVFKGDYLLGATADWVGLQVDASNDAFQLLANGQLMFRQNDSNSKTTANWGAWKGCLTPSNVSGSGGITVTQNDITIGTGDDAFTYKGAVTISHTNSIGQESSTVFKKFSYDGNGHITGVAAVAKADITALGIPAQDTTYSAGDHLSLSSTTFSLASYCKTITNWNDAKTTGWYMGSSVTNAPSTAWWMGRVTAHNAKYCIQEVWQFTANTDGHKVPHKMRMYVNEVWGNWVDITVGTAVPENAVFTDTKVTVTKLAASTADASYYATFASAEGTSGLNIMDSIKFNHTKGTTSAVGNSRLILGNATASGTANNEEGLIRLYSPGTSYHTIKGASTNSAVEHTLPTTGGTILNTGTTGASTTNGKVKINGSDVTVYTHPTKTQQSTSDFYKITVDGTGHVTTGDALTAANLPSHTHDDRYLQLAGGTLTGRVTTTKFLNYLLTGTGTAGADKGSGQNPRYVPAKWTFDTGQTPSDGDIIIIKNPVAGHDYGVYISINNGTSYHPAVLKDTTRLTTHYGGAGNYMAFIFRSSGSAASMIPLAGNTDGTRVTVTGGVWSGFDFYDSGNTYDRTSQQTRIYAGGVGVFRYSICAMNNAQRMESFTTTGDANGSPTTTKTFNTAAKFMYPPVIMYQSANAAYANGNVIGNNYLYEQYPTVDMRYSCNKTSSSGFAQYKPIFIECTFDSNGYFSITSNGFVQTFTSGKYYILVGCMYSTSVYQLALFAQHPLYYYDGTNLRYMPAPHTHSEYLPLAGGTMTGPLTMKANQYSGTYGLDMNNSDIIGANRIVFADLADSHTEGLAFYRTTTDDVNIYDNFWIKNGVMYFTPNAPTTATSYTVLHTGNTSFSRDLTSGTKIGSITIAGTATDIYAPTNTDEKVKVDLFTSTTSTDYMIAGATAAMATTAAHLVIDTADGVASARIRLQKGTTSADGVARLMLGNNIASGTAKNMKGSILIYSSTADYGVITPAALTDDRTWTMPDKTGTVALTSDIPSFSVTSSGTGPVVTGMSYSSGVLTYTKGRVLSTSGGQWIAARDNAPLYANSGSSTSGNFFPAIAVKSKTGAWSIGTLGSGDSLAISYSTDTNYSGGTNSTNNYYFGTDGAYTGTAAGLTAKALTAETFGTTDGSFVFKGTSLFGGTDSYDWVGFQADATNDMFQLVAGGSNGVFFREKDDSSGWGAWYSLLTNAMISGSSGITVTPATFKIGGDDGTTINGAVTISHSNSITAQTDSFVFKKIKYDGQGHICDVTAVVKADIPQLDYIGAKTDGSYWGMATPAKDDTQWIRTTKKGIIPYQARSADATSTGDGNACKLGTSAWYFAESYIQYMYGTAEKADRLKANSTVTATTGVQYARGGITVGTADGNAAEGSNASYKLWSYPTGATSVSGGVANIQNLRLYWSSAYFRDIFISPNNSDIYHRTVSNGTAYAWRKILDSSNYTDYTVTKTGTGATGSWGINITGSAAGLTAKTLTAETFGTTDGSFVFKGNYLFGGVNDWVGFQADAGNDAFQIVANSQLMFRQKDDTWGSWVGSLTPNNVSATSGLKVTKTSTTIGTGDTAFTYNSGVKIEHDVTTSVDTTDSGSLSHGGTFTAITSVTRDSYGHVTTLNTKTYILPTSGNTDTKVNVTLATTTKAYLLGTSTTPTSSAQAVTSVADTGVYLDTTAGRLTATTFKGGLYSYNPASDQSLSNAYPTYTVAYFAYSGGYGGTVGRTGNSGTAWWAHYLTFTHSDRNYRYLLRFPYWGPPQYQRTINGANQRWCNFITDEHVGASAREVGTSRPIDPITGTMAPVHRSNKLAFLPAANITVQTSSDGGSTWTNLSTSDTVKRKLFSLPGRNSSINIGPSSGTLTNSMQTRIIVEFGVDERNVVLDRFLFQLGSGSNKIAIDIYAGTTIAGLTKISENEFAYTWDYEASVTIDHKEDSYYRFSSSHNKYLAFVFRYVEVNSNDRGTINGISGYSGSYWGNDCLSNLANYDHLYSWDIDQNAYFPASVQAGQLAVKSGTYTTTIEKGSTSADRTLVLPDASGGIGVANILFNTPTNSTNPIPVSASLSDYDYFTIIIGMNGSNSEQTSSAIVPAVAGSHYFLFQILESVGSGGSMMFPAGVTITTTSSTISFSLGVNRGITIPSSGDSTSVVSARTAYIKMIIGHKS